VPRDQKYTILAQLYGNGDGEIITAEQIDFVSLIGEESPFISREQNRKRWLVATQSVLQRTISKMTGIRSATVVIAEPDRAPGIGRANVKPSASVTVFTSDGGLGQAQVDAIARLVAKAHPRLTVDEVAVIDATAGRPYQARSDRDLASTHHLDVKRANERYLKSTIEEHLSYIRGVKVAVNVQVDTRVLEKRSDVYQDPKVGPLEERTRTLASANTRGGGEPGVRSNTGAALSTQGGGSSLNDERTDARTLPVFPHDVSHVRDAGGNALKINATISVPRSYFVARYREINGTPDAAPTEAELTPVVDGETTRIQADIEPLIDTGALEGAVRGEVRVSQIPDFFLPDMPDATGRMADPAGALVGGGTDGLVKYVSLGGLALFSLAMMFLMVRKASVREELPSAQELVGIPPALSDADSDLVGEAEESAPVLEGVEVDDEAIERQQMLEQVSSLIRESPDEAAGLVRKWLKEDM
jgi:flagellar M-ring protein FliF